MSVRPAKVRDPRTDPLSGDLLRLRVDARGFLEWNFRLVRVARVDAKCVWYTARDRKGTREYVVNRAAWAKEMRDAVIVTSEARPQADG